MHHWKTGSRTVEATLLGIYGRDLTLEIVNNIRVLTVDLRTLNLINYLPIRPGDKLRVVIDTVRLPSDKRNVARTAEVVSGVDLDFLEGGL